jgi:hypothetical protein
MLRVGLPFQVALQLLVHGPHDRPDMAQEHITAALLWADGCKRSGGSVEGRR